MDIFQNSSVKQTKKKGGADEAKWCPHEELFEWYKLIAGTHQESTMYE